MTSPGYQLIKQMFYRGVAVRKNPSGILETVWRQGQATYDNPGTVIDTVKRLQRSGDRFSDCLYLITSCSIFFPVNFYFTVLITGANSLHQAPHTSNNDSELVQLTTKLKQNIISDTGVNLHPQARNQNKSFQSFLLDIGLQHPSSITTRLIAQSQRNPPARSTN